MIAFATASSASVGRATSIERGQSLREDTDATSDAYKNTCT